jgi:hypothetical protein
VVLVIDWDGPPHDLDGFGGEQRGAVALPRPRAG